MSGFRVGNRVQWRSALTDHIFRGTVLKRLKNGFYLIDDGTGKTPRCVNGAYLGLIKGPIKRSGGGKAA